MNCNYVVSIVLEFDSDSMYECVVWRDTMTYNPLCECIVV